MVKRLLCAAAVMVCFFATPAAADITGNNIYGICKNDPNGRICQGIVAAYTEPWSLLYATSRCISGKVRDSQTREIFLRYIMNSPETRHEPAWILYQASMKRAFGCDDVIFRAFEALSDAYRR